MNKTVAEDADTGRRFLTRDLAAVKAVDIVVCPPFTALDSVSKAILETKNIKLGAQNMSENNFGAFTGEVCAGMLKEFSVRYVILGHSERLPVPEGNPTRLSPKSGGSPRGFAQADRVRGRDAG